MGKGQNEREFWERVGKGRCQMSHYLGKGLGKGHFLRSNFELFSGKGGKGSFERNYA